ncbi:UMP kinase [Buchnera aphidicola]|uniref:Uridylate kinase n=1 Tax=Buchnera aphidicola (Sarucallis kahawaluokalani) TaxID=1241878 RepID=A0A4D6YII9_9GAMM|nr:UMP kinase [Buchnera aphidicola]QCI26191.1 UMP kinase [Buchnera aphidicola (Sarucallis kahawaluokalani)]
MKFIYKRVLLKISGEVIQDFNTSRFENSMIYEIINDIKYLLKHGIQISIVIGGGNLFRGANLSKMGINRITADYIGMLSTVINGLFLQELFHQLNVPVYVMSTIIVSSICNKYNLMYALELLSKSVVVIFCGGIGQPFFTTDSVACIKAIETNSEIVLKGTKVNGVYSKDPYYHKNVFLYHQINYQDVLKYEFKVMDLTAFILARDYKIPICIFNIRRRRALKRILLGEREGTIICDDIKNISI